MNEQAKGIAEVLKEQFALITLVILLSGTVYADAYYSQFGLRLSALGFSPTYIIYRGFTVILDHPSVAMPYVLSAIWFALDEISLRGKDRVKAFRMITTYSIVVLVLVFSYVLAYKAGLKRANDDMHSETSLLPKIKSTKPSIDGCPVDACRILLTDSEGLYILQPTPSAQSATVPNVRILQRKDYSEIVTGIQ